MANKSIGNNLSEEEDTIYQWHHVSGEEHHKNLEGEGCYRIITQQWFWRPAKEPDVSIGTQSVEERMQGIRL